MMRNEIDDNLFTAHAISFAKSANDWSSLRTPIKRRHFCPDSQVSRGHERRNNCNKKALHDGDGGRGRQY